MKTMSEIAREVARKLGLTPPEPAGIEHIENALRRVVVEEREACARLADEIGFELYGGGLARAADDISIAIRNREPGGGPPNHPPETAPETP